MSRDAAPGPRPLRHPSSTRHKARKRALDILFESDLRDRDLLATLADHQDVEEPPVREYTADIVRTYLDHAGSVDARIADALDAAWTLERMNRVDRAAVRVAVTEMCHLDLPVGVAITEAVALAEELSTEESPTFVSGVLNNIASGLD